MKSRRFLRKKRSVALDELGGTADGALVIVGDDGAHLHVTPPRIASALRFLINRLHVPGADGIPSRVALTSALRGEGVTYMTRSLGSVIAYDLEQTVAIVDLNWRDPKPVEADGKDSAKKKPAKPAANEPSPTMPTLVDAVEEGVDVTEIIRSTANPRLSVVLPGAVPRPRRPAMAASRALEEVIDKLAEQFDHLLFDLPPVLASSDAVTLSQLADGVVLVVQQGVTSTTQVDAALAELGGREMLGVLLNRADSSVPPRLRKMLGG